MTLTIKFTAAPSAEFRGKWVARMFSAPKLENLQFGVYGIKTQCLGLFATKEQALEAIAAKKATLKRAA